MQLKCLQLSQKLVKFQIIEVTNMKCQIVTKIEYWMFFSINFRKSEYHNYQSSFQPKNHPLQFHMSSTFLLPTFQKHYHFFSHNEVYSVFGVNCQTQNLSSYERMTIVNYQLPGYKRVYALSNIYLMKSKAPTKQKKKDEGIIPFHDAVIPEPLEGELRTIQEECSVLRRIYRHFRYGRGIYEDFNEKQVIIKYLENYLELYEKDRFAGVQKQVVARDQLAGLQSEELFFKSFNLFRGIWEIRFTAKFLQKLKEQQDRGLIIMLAYMSVLAKGHWPGSNYSNNFYRVREQRVDSPTPYNSFFSIRAYYNRNILFNVGVERTPIMDRQQRITRYEYCSYIQFLDCVSDNDMVPMNLEPIMKKYNLKLLEDTGRSGFSEELVRDDAYHKKNFSKEDLLFREVQNQTINTLWSVEMKGLNQTGILTICPTVFKPTYLSNIEASSLIYNSDAQRWITKDALLRAERLKFNEFQQKVNEQILKKYVDFNSAKNLVELLRKIPNFRIKLTDEQKNVVGQNGNVMVIGRSGTGKTTCAVLRLFAIEMLFKIRVSLNKKKFEGMLRDTRFLADDIDATIGLHSLFVTASPVLTNEIQRYYRKLTDQIKEELEKKRKRLEEERRKGEIEEKQEESQAEEVVVGEVAKQESKQEDEEVAEEVVEIKIPKEESKTEELQPDEAKLEQSKVLQQLNEEQTHMNQQFSGIQMQQGNGIQLQQQQDLQLQQLQNKINKFTSLNDLEQPDYPGFFTVRALIMMLDGTLAKPFFVRNSQHQVVGQESKAAWHNQQKGVMMIENYYKKMNIEGMQQQDEPVGDIEEEGVNYSDEEELEHEYQRQIRLKEQRNKQEFTMKLQSKGKHKLSFEIDFDYFAVHFWPQIKKRYYTAKNISAHLIWTQIYSNIKGNANSHLYPGCYLPQKAYLQRCTNVFLTLPQKQQIYQSFCQYERWKTKLCAYDMMDVVNYILSQMRFRGYSGPSIHYLMIDEVQDLPHATLYLLAKIAQQGVFFSGDTAQTIAKGIGFRFGDLKSMFGQKHFDTELKLARPTVMQLTINFRSHNNILQLANSVISIIEILFPATIDRLKKQRSDLSGPKPIILADSDIQLLFFVLCGQQMYHKQLQSTQGDLLKRPPLQFGCDQVIIVRDQQSKKRIPAILQHALCLTIYEAKGLEFNDVILFNFFAESKCADKWNLIKYLKVIDEEIPLREYEKLVTQHRRMMEQEEERDKGEGNEEGKESNKEERPIEEKMMEQEINCVEEVRVGNMVIVKKVKPDAQMSMKDINDFGELCSELKMLYTAVTRPRNTLIIYDQDSSSRKPLQKYWDKVQVTQIITKQMLDNQSTNKKPRKDSNSAQVQIFSSLVTKTSPDEWKKQGIKMFKRKYFEQAMKCFQMSGETEMYKKARAHAMADESTKEIIEVESERSYIKNKLYAYANMTKQDLKRVKTKLKATEERALQNFVQAGEIFLEADMAKQAGQCFFSGREYVKAQQCFLKANMSKQVAQSLYMQHRYAQAACKFSQSDDYLKSIQCYDMVNDWQSVLRVIHQFNDKIPQADKQALIRKYAALCLQQLVNQVEFENEGKEEGVDKQQGRKELVIHERSSDQEEDEDEEEEDQEEDDDPEIQAEKEYRKKEVQRKKSEQEMSRKQSEELSRKQSEEMSRKQSEVEEIERKESVEEVKEEKNSPKQVPKSPELSHDKSQVIELKADKSKLSESFSDLNEPVSLENSKQQSWLDLNEPDLEGVKSIADPDDEWLGSALSEIQGKVCSEYSVIENEQLPGMISSKARIIKTKGNICVQDDIMKRVISIVSILNTSVVDYLKTLRGHQSLVSLGEIKPGEFELNDFDDIDPEFICKILDTLQSFKIYKLCMFVCNRYHLPSKLGRYLASIALKYSSNAQNNMTISPSLLAPNPHRKSALQKGILASLALHSIFQNINPEFLKVKVGDKDTTKETLGEYCVSGLILEGLYKKVVFMVDVEESLAILSNYMEAEMYRTLFVGQVRKGAMEGVFLEGEPKTEQETELTVLTLEASIWRRLSRMQSELISGYYLKEYHAKELLKEHPIPDYLPFNKCFWNFLDNPSGKPQTTSLTTHLKSLSQLLPALVSGLSTLPSHLLYDTITFSILIFHFPLIQPLLQKLTTDEFANIYTGVQSLYYLMSNLHAGNPNSWWIIRSMLSVYQARIVSGSKIMRLFGDQYIFMRRSSPVVGDLQDQRHREASTKGSVKEQVFFIEQEFNVIIAPFFITFKKIRERILKKLVTFSNLYAKMAAMHHEPVTMEDYQEQQNRVIFNFFMKSEEVRLRGMIAFLKEKNKKQLKQEAKLEAKQAEMLKAKAHKPSIGMQMLAHTGTLQDQAFLQKQDLANRPKHDLSAQLFSSVYFPNRTGHPLLQNFMLQKFLQQCRSHPDQLQSGKFLYVIGLNKHYRQYTRSKGGYFLYDAIQFKLFNRLDMYAYNMQEILSDLSIADQMFYIEEVLLLLLVHYVSLQEKKNFKMELPTSQLRFLEGLKFEEFVKKEKYYREFREGVSDGEEAVFSGEWRYSSEDGPKGIHKLIKEYLQLAYELMTYQGAKQQEITNWYPILMAYVMNLGSFGSELFGQLKMMLEEVSPNLAGVHEEQLEELLSGKQENDFITWRNRYHEGKFRLPDMQFHEVKFRTVSDTKKDVIESEKDYNQYDIVLARRLIASKRIKRWWRRIAKTRPHYSTQQTKQLLQKKSVQSWPIFLYKLPPNFYPQFLPATTLLTHQLISFYLENIVTSSLDLHFILMTLNKLVVLREAFIKLALSDFLEFEAEMDTHMETLRDIRKDIKMWRSDEKWTNRAQVNIKQKKVFEIKWLSRVMKKRAGIKKQVLLQRKKLLMKK